MKRFALRGLFVLIAIFFLNACASQNELLTEQSSSQTATVVPGEKVPGEAVTPGVGPGAAGGNVRW